MVVSIPAGRAFVLLPELVLRIKGSVITLYQNGFTKKGSTDGADYDDRRSPHAISLGALITRRECVRDRVVEIDRR